MEMIGCEMSLRKSGKLPRILALLMVLFVALSLIMPAHAIYRYGYKQGDVYSFSAEAISTATTEEGTATSSESGAVTYRITDIDEDTGSYRLQVKCIRVMATGSFGGALMQEITLEGDPIPFVSGDTLAPTSLFITTDWEKRGDEWKSYVDDLSSNEGWMVADYTKTEGVFTVNINLDVSNSQSTIDYDHDGDKDEYTGSMSTRVEYDSNGVLSSYSTVSNMVFNARNKLEYSSTVNRGGPALSLTTALTYAAVGVICFAVALVLGFLIGRSRPPKDKFTSPPQTSTA